MSLARMQLLILQNRLTQISSPDWYSYADVEPLPIVCLLQTSSGSRNLLLVEATTLVRPPLITTKPPKKSATPPPKKSSTIPQKVAVSGPVAAVPLVPQLTSPSGGNPLSPARRPVVVPVVDAPAAPFPVLPSVRPYKYNIQNCTDLRTSNLINIQKRIELIDTRVLSILFRGISQGFQGAFLLSALA